MRRALLELLRAPETLMSLRIDGNNDVAAETDIESASLRSADGSATFAVREGIPRFCETEDTRESEDARQAQTRNAFAFKWGKTDTWDSPASRDRMAAWLIERYGYPTVDAWAAHFDECARVLDVGCGSGLSSGTFLTSRSWTGRAIWVGVDISRAVDVAQRRLRDVPNTHFVQADALALPFADGTFDAVFSEGVLHHTPSTRAALLSAARVLARGGELSFYVYRTKGAVRELSDDLVREKLRALDDEQAWEVMRGFTRLAQALAALDAVVEVPEAIPMLGIEAGKQHVQRLIYWNFAKLYWNDAMSFEENVHVNFDWYRPEYAHRQTAEQVRAWCAEASLDIVRFDEQQSGHTVVARKR